MNAHADIAAVAALLADPTRAAFLEALMDGRALPAGELAAHAGVSASTASEHLSRLVESGLLAVERSGRHRYFRLADPTVAQAWEALAVLAPAKKVRSLRESEAARAMRFGRTCYDHLAGELGVGLTQALVQAEVLTVTDGRFDVTADGAHRLKDFGIDTGALQSKRRALAPCCLDWTERRHHVAGALGAALLGRLLDLGWIRRSESSRAVRLTDSGRLGLSTEFGLTM